MKKSTVTILLLGLFSSLVVTPIQTAGATGGYVDVPEGAYYADAVEWSVEANITGITSDYFAPAQPSSRGETAVWLWRMAGQQNAPAHTFTDLPTWQSPAVAWLLDQGSRPVPLPLRSLRLALLPGQNSQRSCGAWLANQPRPRTLSTTL